jgi:hypothetical protein
MKTMDADTLIRERTERQIDDHASADQMMRDGMSTEATAVAQSETAASRRGDGFVEVAAGAASGAGIDRGGSFGAGGLATGEHLDAGADGAYWRENFRRRLYHETGAGWVDLREPSRDSVETREAPDLAGR